VVDALAGGRDPLREKVAADTGGREMPLENKLVDVGGPDPLREKVVVDAAR
jgi:hypothetical protein